MLNPIDSFFQYCAKRVFNVLYFFSKKNALHHLILQMLFFIMLFECINSVRCLSTLVYSIFCIKVHWCFLKYLYLF